MKSEVKMTFHVYSRSELIEKVEMLERLVQAQYRSIKELQNVIKISNYDRSMDQETIKDMIEQRNQLLECVNAHLKISDEDRLTEQQQRVIPTTRRSS